MNGFMRERLRPFAACLLAAVGGIASYGSLAMADTVPPKPLTTAPPDYPPRALNDGIEGYVDVEFTVMPDGSVQDVSVVGADPPHTFEVAAVKAVSKWTFKPGTRDGTPIASHVRQKVEFKP